MPEFNKSYIIATIHEFKNNISRFTRLLETGAYSIVFVKRRNEVVGAYISKGAKEEARKSAERARLAGHSPVSSYEDDIFRDK